MRVQNLHPSVSCKWCGVDTPYTGTRMCTRCYELSTRISCDKDLAQRMIDNFKKPKDEQL